jgi:uncharacterized membrane protein
MSRTLLIGLLLCLSFLGIADSWYLADTAARGEELSCTFGGEKGGCETVAESPYSKPLGIPLSVYGVLFYALVLVLSAAALMFRLKDLPLLLVAVTGIGAALSLVFLGVQAFLIKAMCAYCVASALIAFAAFALAWLLFAGRHERLAPASAHP